MKEVTFKPLADRVLLLPDAAEEKTQSGLYLPHQAIKNPPKGKVVAAGAGFTGYNVTVKEGDHVLHAEGVGIKVVLDGTEYLLLREMEILGVL
jgi:chaperonin GroES